MTYKEAYDLLIKEHREDREWTQQSWEAQEILGQLVDKSTAIEPLVKDCDIENKDDNDVECPICGALFGSVGDLLQGEIMKTAYCYNCGQKLNWDELEQENV